MQKDTNLKKLAFKGGVKLSGGQAANQLSSFVKNIIVARLISPADFGIAATFAITLSLLEMVSNLSVEKLLVQSKEGDQEDFQATVQFIQVFRGCIIGGILFLVAGPAARLFGVPEASWAFRWLGIIPVLRGFVHQDINRLQRVMNFWPKILSESGANLAGMIVAYPLAVWFRDYAAMLWIIVTQAAFLTILSCFVSLRKYSLRFHRVYSRQIFDFGWPLMVNGLLMFGILQGDRLIIGTASRMFGRDIYGLEQLGMYSVAFALAFAPTMLITNVSSSLFLPVFSNCQDDSTLFTGTYRLANQIIAIVGGVVAIPLIVSGPWIVRMVYGSKYAVGAALMVWLVSMQAMRIFRVGPTLAAMARGDTRNAMYSNLLRSFAVVGGLGTAYLGADTSWVAFSGFLGECFAFSYCLVRLKIRYHIDPYSCLYPALVSLCFMFLGALAALFWTFDGVSYGSLILSTMTTVIYIGSFLVVFHGFRKRLASTITAGSG